MLPASKDLTENIEWIMESTGAAPAEPARAAIEGRVAVLVNRARAYSGRSEPRKLRPLP